MRYDHNHGSVEWSGRKEAGCFVCAINASIFPCLLSMLSRWFILWTWRTRSRRRPCRPWATPTMKGCTASWWRHVTKGRGHHWGHASWRCRTLWTSSRESEPRCVSLWVCVSVFMCLRGSVGNLRLWKVKPMRKFPKRALFPMTSRGCKEVLFLYENFLLLLSCFPCYFILYFTSTSCCLH